MAGVLTPSPKIPLLLATALTIPLLLAAMPGAGTHADAPEVRPLPIYREVTQSVGLGDFLHAGELGTGEPHAEPPYFMEVTGPGACWLDVDDDGWLDLYLVNGKYLTHPEKNAEKDPHSRLYQNAGDGTFTDVTAATNARTQGVLQACAAADYDNDGDTDLFVGGWGYSTLLRNDGGTFRNVTAHAGVANDQCGDFECWASAPAWFDADQDGCLDLFVGHFTEYDIADPFPSNGPGPGQVNRFYANACDGTGVFTETAASVGLADVKSDTWGAVSADYDNDGDPDLYVANDGDENDLYLNDGTGQFTRKAFTALADARAGMGIAVGDFDHSGVLDIVTTHFIREHNAVFQAFGSDYLDVGSTDPFTDAFDHSGWATHFFDMDNDGHQDLMVVNGDTEDHGAIPVRQPLLAYRNTDGAGAFEAVRTSLGPDFQPHMVGRGGAWADYDNDGDVDFIATEAGENPTHLFRADGVGNRFLNVALEATALGVNRDAVGTRVVLSAFGIPDQMQERLANSGFLGNNDPRLHFGLGENTEADLTVTWPDGSVETFAHVPANSFVRIIQGQGLQVLQQSPRVDLDLPGVPLDYKAPFHAGALVQLPAGRSVTQTTWSDGRGGSQTLVGTTNTTLAYNDVGSFVVRAEVHDDAGAHKAAWGTVTVLDDLQAAVSMDGDVFMPHERPTGVIDVRFSDGAPVADAHVQVTVERTTGDATLDRRISELPYFMRELGGWLPVEIEGTTDANGTLRFQVPHNVVQPSPLVPLDASHPGDYVVTVDGGARGSLFLTTSAQYVIGA